jgi:hypothetical protein
MSMTSRSVELVPKFQRDYVDNETVGFRLRIEARNPSNMSAAVFRYYKRPADTATGTSRSELSGVCSWPDLEELPEGAPAEDDVPQAFRLNYMDVVVRSAQLADEVWQIAQSEIQRLCDTITAGDDLVTGISITVSTLM